MSLTNYEVEAIEVEHRIAKMEEALENEKRKLLELKAKATGVYMQFTEYQDLREEWSDIEALAITLEGWEWDGEQLAVFDDLIQAYENGMWTEDIEE